MPLSENPMPLSPTDCGLLLALSLTLRLADSEVEVDGLKVMVTVQFAPGLRLVAEQLSVPMVNAEASVPPSVIPVMDKARVPAFLTVTVCVLEVPTFCAPKSRLAGEKAAAGAVGALELAAPPHPAKRASDAAARTAPVIFATSELAIFQFSMNKGEGQLPTCIFFSPVLPYAVSLGKRFGMQRPLGAKGYQSL